MGYRPLAGAVRVDVAHGFHNRRVLPPGDVNTRCNAPPQAGHHAGAGSLSPWRTSSRDAQVSQAYSYSGITALPAVCTRPRPQAEGSPAAAAYVRNPGVSCGATAVRTVEISSFASCFIVRSTSIP